MNYISKVIFAICFLGIFRTDHLPAETIVYRTPEGNISAIEVQSESSFSEVMAQLHAEISQAPLFGEDFYPMKDENAYFVDFMVCSNDNKSLNVGSKAVMPQYDVPLTATEKRKIGEIVETLGNASLVSIARAKSSIEKTSKEIETVHPLQFLGHIFSDEKVKAAMHNLHGRGWVWSKFSRGLKDGLEREYENNNLLQYVADFCKRLDIDSKVFYSLAEKQRWKDFIEALFIDIPRPETTGRYDM